jgi:chemotaxis protein MotB
MERQLPWIATVVTAVFVAAVLGLVASAKHHEAQRARQALQELQARLDQAEQELIQTHEQVASLESRIRELETERDTELHQRDTLLAEMQAALESRDVTLSELRGRLTVDILERVLFDSGEAVLKPEGQAVLRKVAGVLAGHPDRSVQVVGHTDNVPIKPAARHRFPSNWELSTARATAAVRFLAEECGLDPRRLSAVGCGEHRPIADNRTAEGRARNRRIEIVVLPAEASQELRQGIPPSQAEPGSTPPTPGTSSQLLPVGTGP